MKLEKLSFGMGDRFAHEANAQLQACLLAAKMGVAITPVWNKSHREHLIIGSEPEQTRAAADAAVRDLGWRGRQYFVDADHITLATFDRFVGPSDFFTMDVADGIGKSAPEAEIQDFVAQHDELRGDLTIPGVRQALHLDKSFVERTARQFLRAVQDAGMIYRAIENAKGGTEFVAEISMDETAAPQNPAELLVILAAVADQSIPIQTIAPKFTGRFNKGVDYVGDVAKFGQEFRDDVATIAYAVSRYDLPANLKLSVHSGSDKFSIYPEIHAAITASGAGVHVKTAGTTWLEEVIGLAEAGGNGLRIAKEIYAEAFAHIDELCAPYATVIDIKKETLPSPAQVDGWTAETLTAALRHNQSDRRYNPSLRQLVHVGFKVAARMGSRYTDALSSYREIIAQNVTENLFERHIRPIFFGADIP